MDIDCLYKPTQCHYSTACVCFFKRLFAKSIKNSTSENYLHVFLFKHTELDFW